MEVYSQALDAVRQQSADGLGLCPFKYDSSK
jgi:hypothetical protein